MKAVVLTPTKNDDFLHSSKKTAKAANISGKNEIPTSTLTGKTNQDTKSKSFLWKAAALMMIIVLVIGIFAGVVLGLSSSSRISVCEELQPGAGAGAGAGAVNINACLREDCTFDVSACSSACPFGYQTDDDNFFCPVTCDCAARGIFAGDVSFLEDQLPDMLKRYGFMDNSHENISLFSSSIKRKNSWYDPTTPDGLQRIYYVIHDGLDKRVREALEFGMRYIEKATCIRFLPRQNDEYAITFRFGKGCSSYVGKVKDRLKEAQQKNEQDITLGDGCYGRVPQHEILHALGFDHEQSRSDRDDYIDILWENFSKGMHFQYLIMKEEETIDLGTLYDFNSILHYDGLYGGTPLMYYKGTKKVIRAYLTANLSAIDAQDVNALYKCSGVTPSSETEIKGISGGGSSGSTSTGVSGEPPGGFVDSTNKWSTWGTGGGSPGGSIGSTDKWSTWGTGGGSPGGSSTGSGSGWGTGSGGSNQGSSLPSGWSPWNPWTPCVKTCGSSMRKRYRYCKSTSEKGCKTGSWWKSGPCPIKQACPSAKFFWEPWQPFGQCTKTCGGGLKMRARSCPQPFQCKPGKLLAIQYCMTNPCATSSGFAQWEQWSALGRCSRNCGGGTAYRSRKCVDRGRLSFACEGDLGQSHECNTQTCYAAAKLDTEQLVPPTRFFSTTKRIVTPICLPVANSIWIFGDFNGDDKTDVICGPNENAMKVGLSSVHGPPDAMTSKAAMRFCGKGEKLAGDLDADGFDDVICGNSRDRKMYVSLSRNGRFSNGSNFSFVHCSNDEDSFELIDSNGDGRMDLLCHHLAEENFDLLINEYLPK